MSILSLYGKLAVIYTQLMFTSLSLHSVTQTSILVKIIEEGTVGTTLAVS